MPNFKSADVEPLERRLESKKLEKWQYPVNIAGGFLIHIYAHEGGHALMALAHGVDIKEFHPYPGVINGEFLGGWVDYKPGTYDHLSSQEHALHNMAGPIADIALTEIISYNLRHGNISEKYQSFWATTSLMARTGPIWIAFRALNGQKGSNDFYVFERNSGVSKETTAGLVGLYTILSSKRIFKEFNVALGRDFYDYKPGKGELNLIPAGDGLCLVYSINF